MMRTGLLYGGITALIVAASAIIIMLYVGGMQAAAEEGSKVIRVTVPELLSNPEKYIGKEVITTGYLRALSIDYMIEKRSEMRYFLEDDAQRIRLIFKQPPSFTLIGKRIKVEGIVERMDETITINVTHYE